MTTTTHTTPADQVTRADWRGATPDLAPDDDRRATVRAWRRELAEWLRAHGIAAHGAVWDAATTGERDLTTLRRIAADDVDGPGLARHWQGHVMPAGLADGDVTEYGTVVGSPILDPDTGTVWIVARRVSSGRTDHDMVDVVATVADVELDPAVAVDVTRGRGNLADRRAA